MWFSQHHIALFDIFRQYQSQMILINHYGCPNNQHKLEHNLRKNSLINNNTMIHVYSSSIFYLAWYKNVLSSYYMKNFSHGGHFTTLARLNLCKKQTICPRNWCNIDTVSYQNAMDAKNWKSSFNYLFSFFKSGALTGLSGSLSLIVIYCFLKVNIWKISQVFLSISYP